MVDGKKIKILLIEDEDEVRVAISELLTANDYIVFSASDGAEGINLAKAIVPDLIICDVMMPKYNGFEVIEILHKEPNLSTIPFLFLTAMTELSDIREGMNLGADDYIVKPYRALDLIKIIETRLKKYDAIKQKTKSDVIEKKVGFESLEENDRILLKTKTGSEFILISDILFISANGEYSFVHMLNGSKFLTRKLVKQWEEQLPSKSFLRIHRSTLVNINYIEKFEKWYNRSYILLLKNFEEKFVVSQRYTSKIKAKYGL